MPIEGVTQEDLNREREALAFETHVSTTHWLNAMHFGSNVAMHNGAPDPITGLNLEKLHNWTSVDAS